MRLSVNSILSVFTFISFLLDKRQQYAEKKHNETNNTISTLIAKREELHTEMGRAAAAARKIREFTNF
jgi:hypothetical protein